MLTPITVTHGDVILARVGLRGASSKNGLIAVKLHRLRAHLDREFGPIAIAWQEIDERYAKRDAAGEPVVLTDPAGNKASWTHTETPAYDANPDTREMRAKEITAFQNGTVTFHAERLTREELASIDAAHELAGLALSLFAPDENTNGAGPP